MDPTKSKRGGFRPGAGRKKKAVEPVAKSFEEAQSTLNRPTVYLTSMEAKRELPAWDRQRLMHDARWVVNNSGIASRIVRGISRYAVGNGLVPKAKGGSAAWNKRAEQLFEDRVATDAFAFDKAASVNFYESQRLIVEQIITDGDFFAQLVKSESGSAMARFIGAEYVGSSFSSTDSEWNDGVLCNADNRPIAYRVNQSATKYDGKFVDVPANDIIHIRRLHRAGFVRGVTWLASSVSRIQDLRAMMENEQLSANLNSKIGLVIESPDAGSVGLGSSLRKQTSGSGAGQDEITLDKLTSGSGSVQLKPGEHLSAHTFDRPNVNFAPWTEFMIREIAWSAGCSSELLWNMTNATGAVARHILQDAEVFFSDIRQMLEYQYCRRFWRFWVWSAIKRGDLEYPGDDWWRSDWVAPQRLTVDYGRDGKMRLDMVRAGLLSRKRYFNELGQDNEAEIDDIIRDAAIRKKRIKEIAAEEGVTLTEQEVFPPAPGSASVDSSEEDADEDGDEDSESDGDNIMTSENMKIMMDSIGVAVRAGVITPSRELEAMLRDTLGAPQMS